MGLPPSEVPAFMAVEPSFEEQMATELLGRSYGHVTREDVEAVEAVLIRFEVGERDDLRLRLATYLFELRDSLEAGNSYRQVPFGADAEEPDLFVDWASPRSKPVPAVFIATLAGWCLGGESRARVGSCSSRPSPGDFGLGFEIATTLCRLSQGRLSNQATRIGQGRRI